jgi:hypothetical protein
MNKRRTSRTFLPKLAAAALLAGLAAAPARAGMPAAAQPTGKKKPAASATKPAAATPAARQRSERPSGEDFYIIVSVNQAEQSLVLKLPTEVTTAIKVNDQTVYLNENGQRIKFADLHAGDTVYLVHRHLADNEEVAVRIRKGPMTVQELHRRYLTFS